MGSVEVFSFPGDQAEEKKSSPQPLLQDFLCMQLRRSFFCRCTHTTLDMWGSFLVVLMHGEVVSSISRSSLEVDHH